MRLIVNSFYIVEFDDDDIELVMNYNLSIMPNGYVKAEHKELKTFSLLHRVIMQIEGFHNKVDHKNGIKLDNRKDNLRPATNSQNGANRKANLGKDLPKGVTLESGKYRARLKVMGKLKSFGSHKTIKEAQAAYIKAAKIYFGEFANEG